MDERDVERDLVGRFLLGTASEDERRQAEERLFADDAFLTELQDREDELIDDYAHGRLSGDARARFERRFLASAGGRARVAFARAASRVRPPARAWSLGWLPTAAAAVFAIATAALGVRTLQYERERRDERARVTAREQELTRRLEEVLRPTPPAPPVYVIMLRAEGTRDSGATRVLNTPAGIESVVVVAPLPAGPEYASYQAVLKTAEGRFVWETAGLHAADRQVRPRLPADVLPPGDYILTLSGRTRTGPPTELADFYFRVASGRGR